MKIFHILHFCPFGRKMSNNRDYPTIHVTVHTLIGDIYEFELDAQYKYLHIVKNELQKRCISYPEYLTQLIRVTDKKVDPYYVKDGDVFLLCVKEMRILFKQDIIQRFAEFWNKKEHECRHDRVETHKMIINGQTEFLFIYNLKSHRFTPYINNYYFSQKVENECVIWYDTLNECIRESGFYFPQSYLEDHDLSISFYKGRVHTQMRSLVIFRPQMFLAPPTVL